MNTIVANSKFSTRSLVTMALFAAILCVSAYISIPLPAGHITFLNFVVLLIALLFPLKESATIVLVWLLLGSVGIPVFISGNAGFAYLISGWGGYSVSFLIVAALLPLLRGKEYHRIYYTILAISASLFVDVFGAVWLKGFTGITVRQAILTGIVPFIPLDLLKSIVVAQIVPQFKRLITFQTTF